VPHARARAAPTAAASPASAGPGTSRAAPSNSVPRGLDATTPTTASVPPARLRSTIPAVRDSSPPANRVEGRFFFQVFEIVIPWVSVNPP
jgi:hypothetical protein